MITGAIAFFIYASCASWLMMRYKWEALGVTTSLICVWLGTTFALWYFWLRAEWRIQVTFSALSKTKWHEYAIRFLFGGAITAMAGIVSKRYGPVIGGVLLAFPAIFPASATLVEKHAKQEKEQVGLEGTVRAADAASVDAAGAAMGSIGLVAFAAIIWQALPNHSAWLVIAGAAVAWFGVSVLSWQIRKTM